MKRVSLDIHKVRQNLDWPNRAMKNAAHRIAKKLGYITISGSTAKAGSVRDLLIGMCKGEVFAVRSEKVVNSIKRACKANGVDSEHIQEVYDYLDSVPMGKQFKKIWYEAKYPKTEP